jgi:hypothetical protein
MAEAPDNKPTAAKPAVVKSDYNDASEAMQARRNLGDIDMPDAAAILATVVDVHCRERGIDPSSTEAGEIARAAEALMDRGSRKPDDLRVALTAWAEKGCTTRLDDLPSTA